MDTKIRAVEEGDWGAITEIFNFYVTESYAAYPD